ncbi:MAG: response regulator, partial [Phycisphaerales bacterium]|nr:response regulator [Phycisphaerales bacterium]
MTTIPSKADTYAVLIVEDDVAQRTTLVDMLVAEEFDAVPFENAESALERLSTQDFVAAIIDQRLPDMPGTDLLQRIREMSPETRVIIHTGFGSFESARDAVNRGAFAYIEKLADPASLITYVHRAVQTRIAAQLHESEERFREVMQSIHDVVWAIDVHTRQTIYVNEAVETL